MFLSSTNKYKHLIFLPSWWRHQMETFSALLAICVGNSQVPGEFPTQRPVTRSFDVFFDLRLNKRLSKQWWGWWFETLSRPLWYHRNVSGQRVALSVGLLLLHVWPECTQGRWAGAGATHPAQTDSSSPGPIAPTEKWWSIWLHR